jgi:acetylornithine deacetylase/succinyl-diaminopimelate desuccinylase-like protein
MKRLLITLVVLTSLLLPVTASFAGGIPDFQTLITADEVMAYVSALAVDIGARPMGSDAETEAANYIAAAFEEWGYDVEIQEFGTLPPFGPVDYFAEDYYGDYPEDYVGDDYAIGGFTEIEVGLAASRNVIATRAGDEQMIVVGAHMDSVSLGTGADDNASGVAAMMAAAKALADIDTVHTLVFVAFGAEEGGNPSGADVYIENLGDDIEHVIAMINVDTVGAGSSLNVYAGAVVTWTNNGLEFEGGPTWVRDTALDLAAEMGQPFGTTPDESWAGYIGDWSDHYAFVLKDVPVAYFEAFGWEGAEDPWWGIETPEGAVMHTPRDVYESVVPEKVERTAEVVAATTYVIASGLVTPEPIAGP